MKVNSLYFDEISMGINNFFERTKRLLEFKEYGIAGCD